MEFYTFDPDFEMMEFQQPKRSCRHTCRPRFHRNSWDQFFTEEPRRPHPIMDFGTALTVLDSLAKAINKEVETKKPKEESQEKLNEVIEEKKSQVIPETPKQVIRRFGTKVGVNETLEKIEITIELLGHKFKPEDLKVQIIDGNILLVKAEGQPKFERQFHLPSKTLIDKIETVFNNKQGEEDKQTLLIKIPKEVKIVQVPISLMEA